MHTNCRGLMAHSYPGAIDVFCGWEKIGVRLKSAGTLVKRLSLPMSHARLNLAPIVSPKHVNSWVRDWTNGQWRTTCKVPAEATASSVTEYTTRNSGIHILWVMMTVVMSLGIVMNNLRVKKSTRIVIMVIITTIIIIIKDTRGNGA